MAKATGKREKNEGFWCFNASAFFFFFLKGHEKPQQPY